jgi:hypothetical protein
MKKFLGRVTKFRHVNASKIKKFPFLRRRENHSKVSNFTQRIFLSFQSRKNLISFPSYVNNLQPLHPTAEFFSHLSFLLSAIEDLYGFYMCSHVTTWTEKRVDLLHYQRSALCLPHRSQETFVSFSPPFATLCSFGNCFSSNYTSLSEIFSIAAFLALSPLLPIQQADSTTQIRWTLLLPSQKVFRVRLP